jgi:hypothetical protein
MAEISFNDNNLKYSQLSYIDIISFDNNALNISTDFGISFMVTFHTIESPTGPSRNLIINDINNSLEIKINNFNSPLGSYFNDILKITNDVGIHIFSNLTGRIRYTKIYIYKIENALNISNSANQL